MRIEYGPAHRGIESIDAGSDALGYRYVLAKIKLPACVSETGEQYVLHPSVMDCALQASIGLKFDQTSQSSEAQAQPVVPFAVETVEILDRSPVCGYAYVRERAGQPRDSKTQKLDIDICDESGRVCVRLKGFTSRVMASAVEESRSQTQTLLLTREWAVVPPSIEQAATDQTAGECERVVVLDAIYKECVPTLQAQWPWMKIVLFKLSTESDVLDIASPCQQIFAQVQAILQGKPKLNVLLQVVLSSEANRSLLWSAVSGLLKSAQLENPRFRGQVIAANADLQVAQLVQLVTENARATASGDTEICYRGEVREVARLTERLFIAASDLLPWKDGGVYLITGGAGGLGLIFAQEISRKVTGAVLVLTGRSLLSEAKQKQIEALQTNGARVVYRQLDVLDATAVAKLVDEIAAEYGHLTGIVHSAGVIHDNFIIKKSVEEFQSVLAPKVRGTLNLDRATQNVALDCFIVFSSVAGVFGNVGQSDYATANAFMDCYARYRNQLVQKSQRHGRTLSINWPLWSEGGMRVDAPTLEQLRRQGLQPMSTSVGIEAMYRAWRSTESQVVVISGERRKLRALLGLTMPVSAVAHKEALAETGSASIEETSVDVTDLLGKVQSALIQLISQQLKVKPADIDVEVELGEFGFDSISLTAFGNTLNKAYGLELSPTIFFEYPSVHRFAEYLVTEHTALLSEQFAVRAVAKVVALKSASSLLINTPANTMILADSFTRRRRNGQFNVASAVSEKALIVESIAIIGMSGCFPGANNLDLFWENLKTGKDSITEIPKSRWDWQAIYGNPTDEANKTNIKWGGFIEGVDEFDPLFFGISPKEAELMDPQQRLLMTYTWKAIEDAGYAAHSLSGSKTGIFVGTDNTGYSELIAQANIPIEGYSSTGLVSSVGPNRMSYLLNLHGPSEPIETACSSSLVAIHRAVRAMQSGDCEMALVGGINTIITPWAHISFSKAGMLCADGRCKTFSKEANGYVRGEGVGMLFLKKRSQAERDGDHIYGLIKGSSENHGGRANSLTAPNPKAQAELIKAAYLEAKIDPRSITYIEAHGTGTPLGDPIEINGLKSAFKDLYASSGDHDPQIKEAHCGIGSVKTNIGHLELAAGVAGVIKVLLQLKHKTLVKSLHCEEINPYIQLNDSPFYLLSETQSWKRIQDAAGNELPRRAGISSFGFGGVNAHVIIEEYVDALTSGTRADEITPDRPALLVLSAKNEERLREQAQQLLAYLASHALRDSDLLNLAYTLQVGREVMEQRLAMTVTTINQLKEKLGAYTEGKWEKGEIEHVYHGEVKKNKETLSIFNSDDSLQQAISTWVAQGKHAKLLELWVKGLSFDWAKLYGEGSSDGAVKPQRISLPTYPFAKERYWIEINRSPAVNLRLTGRGEDSGHASGSRSAIAAIIDSFLAEQVDVEVATRKASELLSESVRR
jgi:polyketide synthase PksN